MERRPISGNLEIGKPINLASPNARPVPTTPDSQGDAIEPFLVGGGSTYYLGPFADNAGPIEVQSSAVQLLAYLFVPAGRTAWIKSIVAAPCVNPIFSDPWRGWDAYYNLREAGPVPRSSRDRATAQAGLWETPLAWEGYRAESATGEAPIVAAQPTLWRWQLTAIPGSLDLERSKRRIAAFSLTDPSTWYAVPDLAVPAQAYSAGLPGRQINGIVGPQRFQATPSAPLVVHYAVPENTTIALWARWSQGRTTPISANGPNGELEPWKSPDSAYPLLPSIGRLSGYMQAATRAATAANAAHGWGG